MIPRSAWLAGAAVVTAGTSLVVGALRPESSTTLLDGAQVFSVKGCALCHMGPDANESMEAGPSLADVSSWAGSRVVGMSAAEYVEQSIRNPSAFISPEHDRRSGGPGGAMPLLQMSQEEIDAVVKYLLAAPDRNE